MGEGGQNESKRTKGARQEYNLRSVDPPSLERKRIGRRGRRQREGNSQRAAEKVRTGHTTHNQNADRNCDESVCMRPLYYYYYYWNELERVEERQQAG